ncbi:MAG TPA: UTP--glucose-1-phosphate uridylyltransferase, partial [Opitutaceae bacterium]|nr:UTP--glucose-1-phosphate uridylyltransferase [Opitutaceae bacterium]
MSPILLSLVEGAAFAGAPQCFEQVCRSASRAELEHMAAELEAFRRETPNFYHRVRAIFFLEAIHRYFLPPHYPADGVGSIPFEGHQHTLERRFEEAIDTYLRHQREHGASDALSSALAAAYHGLEFKTLAQQVQKTVRAVRGNQWMFRTGHPLDYPLRLRPEMLPRGGDAPAPILFEETPVRLDLSHAGWSDIFFLGMDYPEGARVLNLSVDLGVFGRDQSVRPPVCAFLRVIDEPVLRLVSVDLGASADVASLADLFDFAKDYLGLLKAAVIASGVVPSGLEGSGHDLADILARLAGPGRGLEIVSQVRDIPKGSRLAVSTNLLGCLIA